MPFTSDDEDGAFAGHVFFVVLAVCVNPLAVIQVCFLGPQQGQAEGEAVVGAGDALGRSYVNPPGEAFKGGVFGD